MNEINRERALKNARAASVDISTENRDEIYTSWYTCPSCGDTDVAKDARYCSHCGKKLKWPKKKEGRKRT